MATTANKRPQKSPEERAEIRATRQKAVEVLNRKRLLKTAEDACKTARQALESGNETAHDEWVRVAQSTLGSYVRTVAGNDSGATLAGVNRVRND